jgi:hypothetical protein
MVAETAIHRKLLAIFVVLFERQPGNSQPIG